MRSSRPLKIAVGAATAALLLGFLLLLMPILLAILVTSGSISLSDREVQAIVDALRPAAQGFSANLDIISLGMFALVLAFNLLDLALIAFYTVHAAMNKEGLPALRVLLGVCLFTFPFLAMPAYFLIYIAPASPSAWALRPPADTERDGTARHRPTSAKFLSIIVVILVVCVFLIPLSLFVVVVLALLGPSVRDIFSAWPAVSFAAAIHHPDSQTRLAGFAIMILLTKPPNNSLKLTRRAGA